MSFSESGKLPYSVRLYCADCKKDFGEAKPSALGVHFVCPELGGDHHLARAIIDKSPAYTWLRWERRLLRSHTHYSPLALLKTCIPKIDTGWYLFMTTIILVLAIMSCQLFVGHSEWWATLMGVAVSLIVTWRIADIFVTNLAITLTRRFPANAVRTVTYSIVAYTQIGLCYAYFMLVLKDQFAGNVSAVDAIYFSFATMATVGYGDLRPATLFTKLLVVSELILTLYFVAIILAQVSGWAARSRGEEGSYPIQDLYAVTPVDMVMPEGSEKEQ